LQCDVQNNIFISNEVNGGKVKVKSRKDIVSESTKLNKEIEYEHNGKLQF